MLKQGEYIRVKTTTKDDVFGTCIYKILETGLKAPEEAREDAMDGIKFQMLGGTGPSAYDGRIIYDSQIAIARDIASGITEVIPKDEAEKVSKSYSDDVPGGSSIPRTGCMEI